jgi:MFS family permease
MTSERVQRTYLILTLLQTLAASLIWGVNTLFLLDAGLSLTEAFVANAAFTAGMVLFEVPTGVIADTFGRRTSFILGAATLLVTTAAYLGLWYVAAGIWWWVLVSALIGLGFTFFSGATEAWLVDALTATGYDGGVETVFGKGVAVGEQVKSLLRSSIRHGLGNPPIRMFMFGAPFAAGIGIWIFYAFQPYLLELFGDPDATYLAGIAAAVFATAQMIGGASVNWVRRRARSRTGVITMEIIVGALALVGVGLAELLAIPLGFWVAITLLALTALVSALSTPMQQAYMNDCIPSEQRATVLSFASLMGSAGGVVSQPALGRVADVFSLGTGYVVAGLLYAIRLPFILAVRRMRLPADDVVMPPRATGVVGP